MRNHTRNTRLTRGERETPRWVEKYRAHRPDWSMNRNRRADNVEAEKTFKGFIFSELDRRLDAMAAEAQGDETLALFASLLASLPSGSGAQPDPTARAPEPEASVMVRGRGRPKASATERAGAARKAAPAGAAARFAETVREIFEDYWDKRNRADPSAEQLAAEYLGTKLNELAAHKKRAKARRLN